MRRAAVIMTARDTAAYISEAVASVYASIAQVAGWEVQCLVAVDDCPETRHRLTLMGHAHWYSSTNVGTFVLRNSLALLAEGLYDTEVILNFDSDDVMLPLYLPALLAAAAPDRLVGAARYEVGPALEQEHPPRIKPWACVGGNCAIGIDAWRQLGGYWTTHRLAMDTELCDRARKLGIPWRAIEAPLFLRRRNPRSLTQSYGTAHGSAQRAAAVADIARRRDDHTLVRVAQEDVALRYWVPLRSLRWDALSPAPAGGAR